jgi:hypothetical protein
MKRWAFLLTLPTILLLSRRVFGEDARTAIEPFQDACYWSAPQALGGCTMMKKVPGGKRLVLETVAGEYISETAIMGPAILLYNGVQGVREDLRYAFPWIRMWDNTTPGEAEPAGERPYAGAWAFNNYVQIYIDGPANIVFYGDFQHWTKPVAADYRGFYSISGYLVDLK